MLPPMLIIWSWIIVTVILFQKLKPAWALTLALLGAYMFLPVRTSFDLPLIPTIQKHSLPAMTAAVMIMVMAGASQTARRPGVAVPDRGRVLPGWLPGHPVIAVLFVVAVLSVFVTGMLNGDRLTYGPVSFRGLGPYDAGAAVLQVGVMILPFLLGRKLLADASGHRILLLVLCVGGVIYATLALFEVRMSPRLNLMIYGFAPPGWIQHLRGDGFRPMLFLQHGLRVGIFLAICAIAAATLFRSESSRRGLYFMAVGWIFIALALSKTLGAFAVGVLLLPVAVLLGSRLQILVAAIISAIFLFYPLLRSADLVPTDTVVGIFENVAEPARVRSLNFRLKNEDRLLDKAMERPVFGWGIFGRAQVYDPETGSDISVTDGVWAIVIGEAGLVGYLAQFGLLGVPILLLARRRGRIEPAAAGLSLALAANMIDMIPNSSLTSVSWLIAGALAGRLELPDAGIVETEPQGDADPPPDAPRSRYTRQTKTHSRSRQ